MRKIRLNFLHSSWPRHINNVLTDLKSTSEIIQRWRPQGKNYISKSSVFSGSWPLTRYYMPWEQKSSTMEKFLTHALQKTSHQPILRKIVQIRAIVRLHRVSGVSWIELYVLFVKRKFISGLEMEWLFWRSIDLANLSNTSTPHFRRDKTHSNALYYVKLGYGSKCNIN